MCRGGPDNGDEVASAISQAQLPGGDDAWDDWAAVRDDADWDDPEAMRLHTDSYKERRRKAWCAHSPAGPLSGRPQAGAMPHALSCWEQPKSRQTQQVHSRQM